VAVAARLAQLGREVLLVDCDPQGSATRSLGFADAPGCSYLEDLLAGRATLARATHLTRVPGLSLVPASQRLATQDRYLAAELGGEAVLDVCLRSELPERFEYLIFDCPPQLGMLSLNALTAATELIVPVTLDPLAIAVLEQVLDTVRLVQERLNPRLRVAGILPFRVRPSTLLARAVLADLARRFPCLLYPVFIRETIRAAEAPAPGKPLVLYKSLSSAAADFRRLAAAVVAQEQPEGGRLARLSEAGVPKL
jgi:chromosome partitioning protein